MIRGHGEPLGKEGAPLKIRTVFGEQLGLIFRKHRESDGSCLQKAMKVIASHKNNMESIQANKEGKRETVIE